MAFTELLEHLIYIWAISKHGLLIKADFSILSNEAELLIFTFNSVYKFNASK